MRFTANRHRLLGLPLDAIVARLDLYQERIRAAMSAPDTCACDREALAEGLRRLRQREVDDVVRGIHPLGRYPGMPDPKIVAGGPRQRGEAESEADFE